ncbi:conserved repeat domain-containing protein [Halorubrum aquaticum]|uniref:Conserved repeat domain-containing protein n=1 Tax=Halorubrum aquaticum TaxID=387340 RepID=A0A1I3AFJ3_9EURY|nr:DUF1102 domain-containing protein [Halorubrum aquaticum]SFH48755.1 conserved repeat domain-containing protein [Halorubrum aquaticum]
MSIRGSTTTLLILAAIAATALILSTGAAIVDGPTDPLNDEVALQPGDNPYTNLDEDGELVIDVSEDNPNLDAEGVNPNALTVENDLFYVVYNGSEPAEVWIEHDSQAVTFVIKGQPAESSENPTLLTAEDETVPVGVRVDTRVADLLPGDRVLDEISVHARPADPKAITQENGGIDGDGDDEDGDGEDDDDDSDPTVLVDSPDPTARQVEVYSVAVESETEVDLADLEMGDPAVRLDRLSFVRNRSGDVEFSVEGSAEPPESVEPVDRPGVDPLGYYAVSFSEPDQPIEAATAEVVVDRDRLEAAGVDPERLAAYHETDDGGGAGEDDGWRTTETRVIDEADETVRLAVRSDGFSAFAIGAHRPALEPIEATASAETVAPGERVTLEVTLSNVGPVPAEDADLRVRTVDGDRKGRSDGDLADFAVDAEPGATTTESVAVSLEEPGEYDLVLEGDRLRKPATVASLAVREPEPDPDSDPDDGADTDPGDGSADGPEPTPGTGSDDGTGSDAGGEESVSGNGAVGDDDPSQEPTEPAAFDPADFGGLAVLVAIVLATLFLVRRAPR